MIYVQLPTGYKAESINFLQVARIVSEHTGVPIKHMQGPSRLASIKNARNAFCYLALKHCHVSLNDLGQYLGKRDHTTIINSRNMIKTMLDQRHDYAKEVEAMQQVIERRRVNPLYLRQQKAA